jgi:fucose permease
MKTLWNLTLAISAALALVGIFIVLSNPSTQSVLTFVATLFILGVVLVVFTFVRWISEAHGRHRDHENERRR